MRLPRRSGESSNQPNSRGQEESDPQSPVEEAVAPAALEGPVVAVAENDHTGPRSSRQTILDHLSSSVGQGLGDARSAAQPARERTHQTSGLVVTKWAGLPPRPCGRPP